MKWLKWIWPLLITVPLAAQNNWPRQGPTTFPAGMTAQAVKTFVSAANLLGAQGTSICVALTAQFLLPPFFIRSYGVAALLVGGCIRFQRDAVPLFHL